MVTAADPVVAAVSSAVGRDEGDVRSALSVRARPLSRVLEITYTTTASADAAREGVTAAAEAYLDLREKLIIEPVRAYVGGVVKATDKVQADSTIDGDLISRGQAALERRLQRAEAYEIDLPLPGTVIASASVPDGPPRDHRRHAHVGRPARRAGRLRRRARLGAPGGASAPPAPERATRSSSHARELVDA